MSNGNNQSQQKENPIVSIIFNIIIPVIILSKLTSEDRLGPIYGLIVALSFPAFYFLYDYFKRHTTSFIAILGFVSILLTGIIGVFEFPSEWIAYKEASVPLLIGLAVLISIKTPFPLVRKLLYNEELMDVERISSILEEKQNTSLFDKTLTNATYMLAGSFLLSSILNFTLAKILIHSPSGTEAFTQEIGKMTLYSYPVIALPSTVVMLLALWYLITKIKKLTGLKMEELLAKNLQEQMKEN